MFSVITNIYNKKTKGPNLMELFTATRKLKKFYFWQLEMFNVLTRVWQELRQLRKKTPVTPAGIDPETVRLVAQRLDHYATPAHTYT
jgi:hypothetical protein